jgi:hypothetical protein
MGSGHAAAPGAGDCAPGSAGWLGLAAAPTFAAMALLSGFVFCPQGSDQREPRFFQRLGGAHVAHVVIEIAS